MTIYEPVLDDPETDPTEAELNDRSLWQTIPAENYGEEPQTYEPTKGICEKCRRLRRLYNGICGTCEHREMRRINTREMWGHGRRGY